MVATKFNFTTVDIGLEQSQLDPRASRRPSSLNLCLVDFEMFLMNFSGNLQCHIFISPYMKEALIDPRALCINSFIFESAPAEAPPSSTELMLSSRLSAQGQSIISHSCSDLSAASLPTQGYSLLSGRVVSSPCLLEPRVLLRSLSATDYPSWW